ncbi:helix-turn-helix domain-containing protein [Nakamurella sp. GG22]
MDPTHPLLTAVQPLVSRIGATVVAPADLRDGDVPLEWDGLLVAGIRLPATHSVVDAVGASAQNRAADTDTGGLDGIIEDIERSFGGPLTELSRERKQRAVRMFEESGAFSYRKSVEAVAAALGVSRFTVYNYLNRDRE